VGQQFKYNEMTSKKMQGKTNILRTLLPPKKTNVHLKLELVFKILKFKK
jgi:hypothetical protein